MDLFLGPKFHRTQIVPVSVVFPGPRILHFLTITLEGAANSFVSFESSSGRRLTKPATTLFGCTVLAELSEVRSQAPNETRGEALCGQTGFAGVFGHQNEGHKFTRKCNFSLDASGQTHAQAFVESG